MSAKIFLSYSWKDKLEADKVDNFLTDNGYYVQRDIRETDYKRNIKEFMQTIGDSDYVIPLISDTFLRSHNCMYEILELTRNSDYKSRVLQIILQSAKIFNPIDRAKYLEFWSNQCKDLEAILNSNIPDNAKERLKKDFSDFKNIEKTIYDFTTFLSDEIGKTLYDLENENFKSILSYIGKTYKHRKPLTNYRAEVRSLGSFTTGQKFYGKIKLIYNYGFFIQIHSETGYREGILHKNKLLSLKYNLAQLKRFFDVGDDIHVEISEINFNTPSAKNAGGLGFIPTDEFHGNLVEKIVQYLKSAKINEEEVINLSGFGLEKLPKEILEIKSLKRLFISGNKFEDMPLELDLLPNLKTVFCDFKPKRELPFEYVIYQ